METCRDSQRTKFVINICSKITVPVLKFNFNLNLPQNPFPNLWKQEIIIPQVFLISFSVLLFNAHDLAI
jgi:hypothetical protein